ncbi:glycosyltransferase family 4 protein [Enterococcus sp. AZ163]|uniref:glycosyltransferase family 4 protein n=1 Tax=Enterococcus sp. AZ163 TaxID=2774638 RepID=UPI003D2BDBD4
MKKKRVLLLTYGKLPVPAVRGGAIETLIETLIEENERHQLVELFVISREDSAIESFNQKHQATQIISAKTKEHPIWWFFQKCMNKVLAAFDGKKRTLIPYPVLIAEAKDVLQEQPMDCVIDLNCPERVLSLREFYPGKLAVYLHNDYLNQRTSHGKSIFQQLDGIISVCDFLNQQAKTIPVTGTEPQFFRVNNGIDLASYRPPEMEERKSWREKFNIEEKDCVIVFFGRITETKGVHLLLNALSQIEYKTNVKVLIIGGNTYSSAQQDSYVKKVKMQAERLPIDVVFTGYVDKEQIPNYLKAADICAVPSIFHETCCLSAVEAQAMGIPVIATKIGGIPEYISQNSALLIDYDKNFVGNFAKGLDQLIHHPEFRHQLQEQAIKQRNRHSKERYYQEFVASVEALLAD